MNVEEGRVKGKFLIEICMDIVSCILEGIHGDANYWFVGLCVPSSVLVNGGGGGGGRGLWVI
jgi:hypothetical protein